MKSPYQFTSDVDQYYSYLPATFIHKDLSFNYPNGYWLIENQHGKKLPKGTMGMSFMYSPFFLIGHAVALNTKYKADGYSKPYSLSIWYGTIFYFLFGLIFLIKALEHFFNKWIAVIVTFLLFFGTNLLFYVLSLGEMPHSYLFALYSVVVYLTIKWHAKPNRKHLFLLAFFFGLIVIIRPVEIFFALFFIGYNVYNKETLFAKLNLLKKHFLNLLIAAILFFIPIIPQLLYWKIYGGDWLVFSYGSDEKFFFNDPKILDFLFSYRKGWFTYTPLMLLSIIGMFFLKKKVKPMLLVTPLFIGFLIYLLSSWWCWWYGGSFGMRGMIQYYVFLAFPLAALIDYVLKKKTLAIISGVLIIACTYYSLLYSYKMKHWSLDWDGMSEKAYWYTFMKKDLSREEIKHLETLLEKPDYDQAKVGNR
jgi:hypothetical protein